MEGGGGPHSHVIADPRGPSWGRQVQMEVDSHRVLSVLSATHFLDPLTDLSATMARAQGTGHSPHQVPQGSAASTTPSKDANPAIPAYRGLSPSFLTRPRSTHEQGMARLGGAPGRQVVQLHNGSLDIYLGRGDS